MFKWFYLLSMFVSLFCLVIYYERTKLNVNKNFLLLFFTVFISNYGYAQEVFCSSLEGVLSGFQIHYGGTVFTMLFLILSMCQLCQINLSIHVKRFLAAFSLVIVLFISTVANSDLYFKDLHYFSECGLGLLGATHGPCYFIVYVYAGLNVAIAIFLLIYSYLHQSKVSKRTIVGFLFLYCIGGIFYVLPKIFKISFELLPLVFPLLDIIMLYMVERLSMYDVTENIVNVFEQKKNYGYIIFDMRMRFMGANEFAAFFFPSLNKLPIDSRIIVRDGKVYSELLPWIERWKKNPKENFLITQGEFAASCKLSYIISNKRKIGFLVEITDETETNRYIDFLKNYNVKLENKIVEKSEKIQNIQDSIITGMASMVESRDNSTGGHIKRTSDSVRIFLEQIKKHADYKWLNDDFYVNMIKAAPMHDLGKIAVRDSILRKPSKFTPEEYEEMKLHSTEGVRIVANVLSEVDDEYFKKIAENVAHYHHEKWDGTGYPCGLKGEEIPIEARIMALSDVFDALVTSRCYKEAFDYDDAFDIIIKDLGTHFDPELGKIFLECRSTLEQMYTMDSIVNNVIEKTKN